MERYTNNPKWLLWFAPFRGMALSAAFLMPFFLAHGLTHAEVFWLQTIFSLAVVAWELPSGYIADRFGPARCIKISAPIAAVGMIAYGFSSHFWQFAVCELVLAVANGLISGADDSLLFGSLKAAGRQEEAEKLKKRINALNFGARALAIPASYVMVKTLGMGATIIGDGLLTIVGMLFAFKLVDTPERRKQPTIQATWRELWKMVRKAEIRWLLVLSITLGTATYISAWVEASYYQNADIPLAMFAVIVGGRSLWKASWSQWVHPKRRPGLAMAIYCALAGLGYLALASSQWWLIVLLLGHDIVHALQGPAIMQRLNERMHDDHRATLNSAVNLLQKLAYSAAGPFIGWTIDHQGMQFASLTTGAVFAAVAFFALARLTRYHTFRERR